VTPKRESELEEHLRTKVEAIGGVCLKWISPGTSGVPDRIVLVNGQCRFVEMKRPTKNGRMSRKRASQINIARKFAKLRITIHYLWTEEHIDWFVWKLEHEHCPF
jgi:hypothetical protein